MRRRLVLAPLLLILCGLAAVAVSTAPARTGGGVRYVGTSSQAHTVSLTASRGRKSIRGFRIERDFACSRGSEQSSLTGQFQQVTTFLKVGRRGRFHGHRIVTGGGGSLVRRGMICIRGRLGKNRVTGRLREKARLGDGSLCSSGRVTFSATRR